MGIEQPGRTKRTVENIVSKEERREPVRADDVSTSQHLYLLENGETIAIRNKIRAQDEYLFILGDGSSRTYGVDELVPVEEKLTDTTSD